MLPPREVLLGSFRVLGVQEILRVMRFWRILRSLTQPAYWICSTASFYFNRWFGPDLVASGSAVAMEVRAWSNTVFEWRCVSQLGQETRSSLAERCAVTGWHIMLWLIHRRHKISYCICVTSGTPMSRIISEGFEQWMLVVSKKSVCFKLELNRECK